MCERSRIATNKKTCAEGTSVKRPGKRALNGRRGGRNAQLKGAASTVQGRSIPKKNSSAMVTSAEINSEPRQPKRLEKKRTWWRAPEGVTRQQHTDQRKQSVVFGAAAVRSQELSYVDQRRPSA